MNNNILEEKNPKQLQQMVLDYLNDRFGLDESKLSTFCLYLASKGRVYLGPKRLIERPNIVTLGLLIARISGSVKPTTNLFQILGQHITKNIVQLDRIQTIQYAKGADIVLSEEQIKKPVECTDGYVLLRYQGAPLGCGLLKAKNIKNMLPKAKRLELKFL